MSTNDTTTKDRAQEKAQEALGEAQDKAQGAAGQARHRVRDEVEARSAQAGEQAHSVAQGRALGRASTCALQGKDQPAKVAEQAADRAGARDYLKQCDGDRSLAATSRISGASLAVGRDRAAALRARDCRTASSRRPRVAATSSVLRAPRTSRPARIDVDGEVSRPGHRRWRPRHAPRREAVDPGLRSASSR